MATHAFPFETLPVPHALLTDEALPRLAGIEGLLVQTALSMNSDGEIDPEHLQAGLRLLAGQVKEVRDTIEAFLRTQ